MRRETRREETREEREKGDAFTCPVCMFTNWNTHIYRYPFTLLHTSLLLSSPLFSALLLSYMCTVQWSMIDAFVMVMMMVAFRIHIASPDNWAFLPPNVMSADVIVTPRPGFLLFMCGALLSLLLNNVILAFHRNAKAYGTGDLVSKDGRRSLSRAQDGDLHTTPLLPGGSGAAGGALKGHALDHDVMVPTSEGGKATGGVQARGGDGMSESDRAMTQIDELLDENQIEGRGDRVTSWFDAGTDDVNTRTPTIEVMVNEREALMYHEFECPRQGYKAKMTCGMRFIGVLLLLVSAFMTLIGGIRPSFSFQFQGLISVLVGDIKDYSLVSVATSTTGQLSFLWQPAATIYLTQVTFICVGLVFPVLTMIMLLALWTAPLTLQQQKRLFYASEVRNVCMCMCGVCV